MDQAAYPMAKQALWACLQSAFQDYNDRTQYPKWSIRNKVQSSPKTFSQLQSGSAYLHGKRSQVMSSAIFYLGNSCVDRPGSQQHLFLLELNCFRKPTSSPQLLSPPVVISSEFINARHLQYINIPASLSDICSSVYMTIRNDFRLSLISVQNQGKFLIHDHSCNSLQTILLAKKIQSYFPPLVHVLVVIRSF